MADTFFTNASGAAPGTLVVAQWLNDVNTNTYTILASVTGTNTITGTAATTVTVGYPRGVAFRFLPVNTNTGPATINISGLGVKNITKFGTAPLTAGDLIAGSWAYLTYDGTQFQLINAGGPLSGVDTYITTAGSTAAYTLTFQGSFAFISGYAVKLIFNATNTTTTPTLNVNGSGVVAMKVMDTNGNKIDPIVGAFAINTPATAIYDGVNWIIVVEFPSGKLLNTQTFLASGTYTPTPGTTRIIVEGQGSGGAGGGNAGTAAGQVSVGGGGGAGGIGKTFITSGFSPTTAVTIGAVGVGGAGSTGGSGGASSFGAFLSLPGGAGGAAGAAGAISVGAAGAGGTATGGTIVNAKGADGTTGVSSFAQGYALSSKGADSLYGSGGVAIVTGGGSSAGNAALGRASGGGGAASLVGAGAAAGGNGTAGIIIVYEYS